MTRQTQQWITSLIVLGGTILLACIVLLMGGTIDVPTLLVSLGIGGGLRAADHARGAS